jgi:hypothetical protein
MLPERLVLEHHVPCDVDVVRERQQVADPLEELRERLRREVRAGKKGHRQVDAVQHCHRSGVAADEGRPGEPECGERERTEDDERRDRGDPVRYAHVEQQRAEDEQDQGGDRERDQDRRQQRGDVRRGRQGRRAQTLERAVLASVDERHRESAEPDRRSAVADHPGEQILGTAHSFDLLVLLDRAEHHVQDQRQHEREERELAVAPEEPLLVPKLVEEELHAESSCVSVR